MAISQEDDDLAKAARFLKGFGSSPAFPIVADLERTKTKMFDRTTAYLVDEHGIVQQVFPMLIHSRPALDALLGEISRLSQSRDR